MISSITNLDLSGLEEELVERLQPLNQGTMRVAATPEDANELRSPKGDRALVAFRGLSLQQPANKINPQAPIIQPGEIRFVIVLQVKSLRSHQGALPLIQQVIDLLTGFCPELTGKPIYHTTTDFVSVDEGIWTWSLSFNAPMSYVKRPR